MLIASSCLIVEYIRYSNDWRIYIDEERFVGAEAGASLLDDMADVLVLFHQRVLENFLVVASNVSFHLHGAVAGHGGTRDHHNNISLNTIYNLKQSVMATARLKVHVNELQTRI